MRPGIRRRTARSPSGKTFVTGGRVAAHSAGLSGPGRTQAAFRHVQRSQAHAVGGQSARCPDHHRGRSTCLARSAASAVQQSQVLAVCRQSSRCTDQAPLCLSGHRTRHQPSTRSRSRHTQITSTPVPTGQHARRRLQARCARRPQMRAGHPSSRSDGISTRADTILSIQMQARQTQRAHRAHTSSAGRLGPLRCPARGTHPLSQCTAWEPLRPGANQPERPRP